MKQLLSFLILSVSLSAQCWLPIDPPGLFNDAFKDCHVPARADNAPKFTHRFSTPGLTAQQTALVKSIAMVEQGLTHPSQIDPGQANEEGDNGKAQGPLQIHEGYFRDARSFDSHIGPADYPEHLTYSCWRDGQSEPEQALYRSLWWANSVGIWYAYGMRYSPYSMLNMSAMGAEIIARRHNGGPNGDTKKATDGYWAKVKEKLVQHYPGVIPGL